MHRRLGRNPVEISRIYATWDAHPDFEADLASRYTPGDPYRFDHGTNTLWQRFDVVDNQGKCIGGGEINVERLPQDVCYLMYVQYDLYGTFMDIGLSYTIPESDIIY